jgi:AcrR family transcriptional regulator
MQKRAPQRHARTATYEKGQVRIEAILEAAAEVLITRGYKKMTMRKIALQTGITVGNLNYYYSTKDALLKDLLENVLSGYLGEIDRIIEASDDQPVGRFVAVIEYLIEDLNTRQTTRFFPELWALANHDDHVAELMEEMYIAERDAIEKLIQAVNPELGSQRSGELALFISCTIEGMTMFVGEGKHHTNSLQVMKKMACESFLQLISRAGVV